MPTITQLPVATQVNADDSIPISQGGVAKSVAVGTLLAQTQPVIMAATSSLLGRVSLGVGCPEQVDVGQGLALNSGTLAANGGDHAFFATEGSLQLTDQLVVNSGGTPKLVGATAIRAIFTPGSNIAIDPTGVISATIENYSGTVIAGTFSINSLASTTTIASPDLLPVSQSGVEHSITYANLLNGQTIDAALAAGTASSSDTFWCSQGGSTMVRQTLGALWQWVAGNAPSLAWAVSEITSGTPLSASAHNGHILICSQPLTLSVVPANLDNGFWCEVINLSTGWVTLSGTVSSSSGSTTIPSGQSALLRYVSYSGGTILYANISGAASAVTVPGPCAGLVSTSVGTTSVGLSWQVPTTGGAASAYTVQYRISGASAWTPAATSVTSASYLVTGLSSSLSYDFSVFATNSAGTGPLSNILTVSTTTTLASPGQPGSLTATVASSSNVSLSWQTPASGGPVTSYTAQYRVTGGSTWTTAVSGITSTSQMISGLSGSTSYDFSVYAVNAAGSSLPSSLVTVVTPQFVGSVTSITWNVVPAGSYTAGSGAIGINAQINPGSAAVRFGFSTSASIAPTGWTAGSLVNSNLWGAYVPTPSTAGSWYAWVEGTDGSCPTVYQTAFTVH